MATIKPSFRSGNPTRRGERLWSMFQSTSKYNSISSRGEACMSHSEDSDLGPHQPTCTRSSMKKQYTRVAQHQRQALFLMNPWVPMQEDILYSGRLTA